MEEYSWAEIGGVTLAGGPGEMAEFRGLMLSRLIGWRGLSGARGDGGGIPGANGAFPLDEILREPRSMELRGAAVAGSANEASVMLELLETVCADGPVALRVSDATGIWSRSVEVEVMIPADAWNRSTVPFTLDLLAPDPYRYRDAVTVGPVGLPVREGGLVLPSAFPWNFGTSVIPVLTLDNVGTVPILPIVRVRGAASGVVVYGGPRRVEFGAFDGELVIDNRSRRVWLNGVDVTIQLVRRDWQAVPAGAVQDFYFQAADAAADTNITVEYQIGAK